MTIRATPAATHVIAVGISRYQIGDDWKLATAADDALRFAKWARKSNVPRENIYLFANAIETDGFSAKVRDAGLNAARSASSHVFENFLSNELAKLSGELLYLFWSGHGCFSENSRRVLFYEDLRMEPPRALDLNHLFVRLRCAPHGGFNSQIAYVDACANRFEDLGFNTSFGTDQPGTGRLKTGIRQTFFLAADSGEQAVAGDFSARVLEALEKQTEPAWPPDPDAIVDTVRSHFDRANEQRPVQISWRNSRGDEYAIEYSSGDLPASKFVNAAAVSSGHSVRSFRNLAAIAERYSEFRDADGPAARDSLYASLQDSSANCVLARTAARASRIDFRLDLLHIVAFAFCWNAEARLEEAITRLVPEAAEFTNESARLRLLKDVRALIVNIDTSLEELKQLYHATVKTLSDEPDRVNASTLDAMLHEVSTCPTAAERERYNLLFEFVLRIGKRYDTAKPKLEKFVRERSNQMTINTIYDALNREQRFLLSISIEPGCEETPNPAAVEARLLVLDTAIVAKLFRSMPTATWSDAEAVIAEIVRESRRIVIGGHGLTESDLEIEFLLPDTFFTVAPDRFVIELNKLQRRRLGKLHPVVIRWRERVLDPSNCELVPWQEFAQRVDRGNPGPVHWLEPIDCSDGVSVHAEHRGLLGFRFFPGDEIYSAIEAGYPFIAWLRSELVSGDWDLFAQVFDEWVSRHPFGNLPRQLHSIRRQNKAELGSNLTLFWDDLSSNLTLFWDDPARTHHWKLRELPSS